MRNSFITGAVSGQKQTQHQSVKHRLITCGRATLECPVYRVWDVAHKAST
jgi:hypothetical protein